MTPDPALPLALTQLLPQLGQLALAFGCAALALWCAMLARRLRRLNDLDQGLGAAIAVMSVEVARLEQALARTRAETAEAGAALGAAIDKAQRERALWAVQARFTPPPAEPVAPRPRTRRRREETVGDSHDAE